MTEKTYSFPDLFEATMEIIKIYDSKKHAKLVEQIRKLNKEKYVSGIDKQSTIAEFLSKNEIFRKSVCAIATSRMEEVGDYLK